MIRRSLRIGLLLGLIGAVAFALTKVLGNQDRPATVGPLPTEPWPRLSSDPATTAPPIARAVPDPESLEAWVEPTEGVCPTTHPVKAKLASKIFHLPGMANYERTRPDRCYVDATRAEADGLRPAKR